MAIADGADHAAIETFEATMMARAEPSARDAAAGMQSVLSSDGAAPVLAHCRERIAA